MIKSANNLISAHEAAGKERDTIARELSEWGEQTQDDAVSDISDKIGVILSELGAQEDSYAHNLDDARGVLKTIRNTEKSVQPSRDNKGKIADEIQKLKFKEPQSTKLVILEQELVRAEAENLVAEAQLTNIVCFFPFLNNTAGLVKHEYTESSDDGLDPQEAKGSLRYRVCSRYRARREANHSRKARTASALPSRRLPNNTRRCT